MYIHPPIEPSMDNAQLIQKFYTSFAAADAEGMVSCYADDIQFEDPAFGPLKGNDAKNMWRMLLKTPGIKITASNIKADEKTGRADWVAEYTFSLTGRKVINNVSAQFEFADGKITRHTDHFSFWKWASQAFGFKGVLLGWTLLMKNKVRQQALARLAKFVPSN
jgi:ketosteroid isomerase-like protein